MKDKPVLSGNCYSFRGFGSSTVFGSGGTIVNIEHWRCLYSLRGHSGGA